MAFCGFVAGLTLVGKETVERGLCVSEHRRRRCGGVVRMGKEQKVKSGAQTSGIPFGSAIPKQGGENSQDYLVHSPEVDEVARKNSTEVERMPVEVAEDPFQNTQPKRRTTSLPEVSAEKRRELRVPFGTEPAIIIETFLDIDRNGEELLESIIANRHLLSTAFLYNMTSKILKAESIMDDVTGDRLRDLRAKIIDACSVMDKEELVFASRADVRVRDVVMDKNVRAAVSDKGGETVQEVNWFWVVMHGAISAWELQAEEGNASPYQQKVYDQLITALEHFLSIPRVNKLLGEEYKLMSQVFNASKEEKKALLRDVDDELLVKVCMVCCRVERLKFTAYRGLLRRLYEVRNFALKAKYGDAPHIAPERFTPEVLPVTTSFDKFIKQNQTFLNVGLDSDTGGISTFGF